MKLQPAICTQCGGHISVDVTKEAGICKMCETPFITEKVTNNYHQTVNNTVNQNISMQGANVDSVNIYHGADANKLIKRAYIELEDGNWNSAIAICDKIADLEPENSDLWILRLLIEAQAKSLDDLEEEGDIDLRESKNFHKAVRYNKDESKKAKIIVAVETAAETNEYAWVCIKLDACRGPMVKALADENTAKALSSGGGKRLYGLLKEYNGKKYVKHGNAYKNEEIVKKIKVKEKTGGFFSKKVEVEKEEKTGEYQIVELNEPGYFDIEAIDKILETDVKAQVLYSVAFYQGKHGLIKDHAQSFSWRLKAANNGCADSQLEVAYHYGNGIGVNVNYAQAVAWLKKSAEQGYVEAIYKIGDVYAYGNWGVSKDPVKGVKYYKEASSKGHIVAKNNLAHHLFEGIGCNKNEWDAGKLFKEAAEAGNVTAQHNMGWAYHYGRAGFGEDKKKAIAWYQKAAQQGYTESQKELRELGASW